MNIPVGCEIARIPKDSSCPLYSTCLSVKKDKILMSLRCHKWLHNDYVKHNKNHQFYQTVLNLFRQLVVIQIQKFSAETFCK